MTPNPIECNEVNKCFGEQLILNKISFKVRNGECFGLLGPNGTGKSTIIKILLGLLKPNSGTVSLAGYNIATQANIARSKIGIVPQYDNLDPDFTVYENLSVFARYFSIKKDDAKVQIAKLLKFANLTNKSDYYVDHLSGGMRRRLIIARALINQPNVLILDEPTTALDPQARHLIWERLRQLKEEGMTLLLTTHFMEEAARLCDRLCILHKGEKLAEGSPKDLVAQLNTKYVIEIFNQDNLQDLAKILSPFCEKIDQSGETLFCYGEPTKIIPIINSQNSNIKYLQRPPNLEDVFLRLTGRTTLDD